MINNLLKHLIRTLRRSIVFIIFLLFSYSMYAQNTNTGIFFQAVARDKFSNPAKGKVIYIQSTILQESEKGINVLTEEFRSITDAEGIFSISIGLGTKVGGSKLNLQDIEWSKGPYFLNLKIAISPALPSEDWVFEKEWIDLGTTIFGVVPYALHVLERKNTDTNDSNLSLIHSKLNINDTSEMLISYAKKSSLLSLESSLSKKISVEDTASILASYAKKSAIIDKELLNFHLDSKINLKDSLLVYTTPHQLALQSIHNGIIHDKLASKLFISDTTLMLHSYLKRFELTPLEQKKLDISDTSVMMNARIARDTISLSNRIDLKENVQNKVFAIVSDSFGEIQYPTVNAVKSYVDSSVAHLSISGVADATTLSNGLIRLSGDLTGSASQPLIQNGAILSKLLMGFNSNSGTITDTDNILQAFEKLDGNIGFKLNKTDTSSMLLNYRTSMVNNDFKIASLVSDTATIQPRFVNVINLANSKLSGSDTITIQPRFVNVINLAKSKLSGSDTTTIQPRFNNVISLANSKLSASDSLKLSTWKLNKTDTSSMLLNYRTSMIDNDVKIAALITDTATIQPRFNNVIGLANSKLSASDTLKLSTWKLNKTDTSSMLLNYKTSMIDNDLKIAALVSDTATIQPRFNNVIGLANSKLSGSDTTTIQPRFVNVIGLANSKLSASDTLKLSTLKLNKADTSSMLLNYKTSMIDNDVKIAALVSDTATIQPRFNNVIGLANSKLSGSDTTTIQPRFVNVINLANSKLSGSDTTTIQPRFNNVINLANSKLSGSDTTTIQPRFNNVINLANSKLSGSDTATIQPRFNNVIDLANSKLSGSDTATIQPRFVNVIGLANSKLSGSDTTTIQPRFNNVIDLANSKLSGSDTATIQPRFVNVIGLANSKLSASDTLKLSTWKLNKTDTGSMLLNYRTSMIDNNVKIAALITDTATIQPRFNNVIGLANSKLSGSDTTTIQPRFNNVIDLANSKLSGSDTATIQPRFVNVIGLANSKLSGSDTTTIQPRFVNVIGLANSKLSGSDTATIQPRFVNVIGLANSKLSASDTLKLSTWKLNKTDTGSMLLNYRTSMIDNDVKIAALVSDTATIQPRFNNVIGLANSKLSGSDTTTIQPRFNNVINLANSKLSGSDTTTIQPRFVNVIGLANSKLSASDTLKLSTWKLNKTDTGSMLLNYRTSMIDNNVKIAALITDTATIQPRFNNVIGLANSKLNVDASHFIGTTAILFNRTSGAQALTGITSIDGNAATATNVTGIVAGANGGTGVANSGKSIILGGDLTTSGANATTLITTGLTSITLPTTGTLATLSETETLTNKTLVAPILGEATATSLSTTILNATGDIKASRFKLTLPVPISATSTTTIDLSTGNIFQVNLGLNVNTLTLTNPEVGTYIVKFVQDATGSRDVVFPVSWKWSGAIIPNLTNAANKVDIVTLIYDGSTYYAAIVQNF